MWAFLFFLFFFIYKERVPRARRLYARQKGDARGKMGLCDDGGSGRRVVGATSMGRQVVGLEGEHVCACCVVLFCAVLCCVVLVDLVVVWLQ